MIKYIIVDKYYKNEKILLIELKEDLYYYGFISVLDILFYKDYKIYKKIKSSNL